MKFEGVGFGGILFLIFLVLKLTGHISWSWWWITAPVSIPLAIAGLIAGFCLIICGPNYFKKL